MKFSVITICLDCIDYVEESIESVLSQTGVELEYILIDGGSTDGSLEVIQQWASKDNRVRWSTGSDRGIADAMNKGLALAGGDWVAFLHADDRFLNGSVLGNVSRVLSRRQDKIWATGGIREIDAEGQLLRTVPVRNYSYRRLRRNNIILHSATFVRRDVLIDLKGFDPDLKYTMDYDLWLKLGQKDSPLLLETVVADFRVHQGSLSSRERMQTLAEGYSVRKGYVEGPFNRLGHYLYYLLTLAIEKAMDRQG